MFNGFVWAQNLWAYLTKYTQNWELFKKLLQKGKFSHIQKGGGWKDKVYGAGCWAPHKKVQLITKVK